MRYAFSYLLCIDVRWRQYRLFSAVFSSSSECYFRRQGHGHPGVLHAGGEKNHISIITRIQQMKHARLTHLRAEQTINYTLHAVA